MIKMNNIKKISQKNYKLYKSMAGVTALVITASFLSGCGITGKYYNKYSSGYSSNYNNTYNYENDQKDQSENNVKNQTTNTTVPTTIEEYSVAYDIDLKSIFSKEIMLSDNDVIFFQNEISKIQVNYPCSYLYYSDINLEKYNNIQKYESQSSNIFINNKINGDIIYSIVLKNNLNEGYSGEAKISNTNIKKICDKIAETINYILSKSNNVDLKLLSEKIQNLKIRNFTGFSNGSYDSETGVMWLDVSNLNSDSKKFEKIISHETVHLVQSNSLDEINNSKYSLRMGPSYRFDSQVNSLNWTWFSEGTAETIMMDKTNTNEALTYSNLLKIIETIKLSTIINPNINVSDFEYLSLDSDLNELFKYFDCKTEDEKIEIINMMFSYEFLSGLSGSKSASEFYSSYEAIYGKMDFQTKELFKKQLRGAIAQTLSKQFYKNLSLNIKNKRVSIKDIFEIISIYESEMNKLTWYATPEYTKELGEFITNYVNIQEMFFKILSEKTNLSLEEIQLAYEIYNLAYEYDVSNVNMLSSEKKEYIKNIKNNRKDYKTVAIRYFYTNETSKKK